MRTLRTLGTTLLACAVLAGCGGMRIVDSEVQAYATADAAALAPPLPYRFERLPSQRAAGSAQATQAALEALAQPVLAGVGLQRDDTQARFSVQIEVRVLRTSVPPWDLPIHAPPPVAVVVQGGVVLAVPTADWRMHMHLPPPTYLRELVLIVRRLADAQVVFESRARHDGPWSDDAAVLPAMLQAALQGFPAPPAGMRRVTIEIPR